MVSASFAAVLMLMVVTVILFFLFTILFSFIYIFCLVFDKFCYLGDMLSIDNSADATMTASINSGWNKFSQSSSFLTAIFNPHLCLQENLKISRASFEKFEGCVFGQFVSKLFISVLI